MSSKAAPKPKAKASKTVKLVKVKNLTKFTRRQPSSGISIPPGETKELVLDYWVKANEEIRYLEIVE